MTKYWNCSIALSSDHYWRLFLINYLVNSLTNYLEILLIRVRIHVQLDKSGCGECGVAWNFSIISIIADYGYVSPSAQVLNWNGKIDSGAHFPPRQIIHCRQGMTPPFLLDIPTRKLLMHRPEVESIRGIMKFGVSQIFDHLIFIIFISFSLPAYSTFRDVTF